LASSKGSRASVGALGGGGLAHLVVDAGDEDAAVLVGEAGQQLGHALHRIGDRTAPHAAVQRVVEARDLDVDRARPRSR
jgi:hypothetical protein